MQFANTLKTNGYSNTKFYTSASWIGTNTETCQMNYNTLGGPKNLWAAQYLYGKPSSNDLKNQQYGAWQYTSQMYYQGTSNLKKMLLILQLIIVIILPLHPLFLLQLIL